MTTENMTIGQALETVHAMARQLYTRHGEFCAGSPYEAEEALDMVEDMIVNDYPEEDE
jgi:hypothetical protein